MTSWQRWTRPTATLLLVSAIACGGNDSPGSVGGDGGQAAGEATGGQGGGGMGGQGGGGQGGQGGGAPATGGHQWTEFEASVDTRVIYLSSSLGDDAADCLSEATACATLSRGLGLLRDGFPDWLLLRRGDEWTEPSALQDWQLSGRSADEPMVFASYGEAAQRPLLKTGQSGGLHSWHDENSSAPQAFRYVAMIGLHFFAHSNDHRARDLNGKPITDLATPYEQLSFVANELTGIFIGGPVDSVLIEDCRVEGYGMGVVVASSPLGGPQDIALRANVIIDNYADRENSQGMYLASIAGLLLEANVIDYNGWHDGVSPWTMFDHSVYNGYGSSEVVVRNNIVSRSDGVQVRSGAIVQNNLFARTATALTVGISQTAEPGVGGRVRDNVIVEGTSFSGEPRARGIDIGNISPVGLDIHHNIIANSVDHAGPAFTLAAYNDPGVGVHNTDFRDNIVYNWGRIVLNTNNDPQPDPHSGIQLSGNIFALPAGESTAYEVGAALGPSDLNAYTLKDNVYSSSQTQAGDWARIDGLEHDFASWTATMGEANATTELPSFPDPNRNPASYNASLGGEESFEAFIAEARQQSKGSGLNQAANPNTWREAFTAAAVNDYIRAGFGW